MEAGNDVWVVEDAPVAGVVQLGTAPEDSRGLASILALGALRLLVEIEVEREC